MPYWRLDEDDCCTKLELVAISAVSERITKNLCLVCKKLPNNILELVCLNLSAISNSDLVLAFLGRRHDSILTYLVKRWEPASVTIQRIRYSILSKLSWKCYEVTENRVAQWQCNSIGYLELESLILFTRNSSAQFKRACLLPSSVTQFPISRACTDGIARLA